MKKQYLSVLIISLVFSSAPLQALENYIAYCEGCNSEKMRDLAVSYIELNNIQEGNVIVYDQKYYTAVTFEVKDYGSNIKIISNPKEINDLIDGMKRISETLSNDSNNIKNKPKPISEKDGCYTTGRCRHADY